jgi:hypothetical protein
MAFEPVNNLTRALTFTPVTYVSPTDITWIFDIEQIDDMVGCGILKLRD